MICGWWCLENFEENKEVSIYMNQRVKTMHRYIPLVKELVIRDLKVKYRRSFLGYLWSLLNPLLMMLVMTIAFSYVFRFDIENYSLYLITGQIIYNFFNESTTMAMTSVVGNAGLIKKVYIPKYIFPISRVVSCFVNMLFSLGAVLIVMIFTHAPFHWTILLIPIPLFLLLVFCCGIGSILAALTVFFRDVIHLYSVCTLALMYLTPIFYPIDSIPLEISRWYYLNPMVHYLSYFRNLVLYGTLPTVAENFACIGISALTFAFGMFIFSKMQKRFAFYL